MGSHGLRKAEWAFLAALMVVLAACAPWVRKSASPVERSIHTVATSDASPGGGVATGLSTASKPAAGAADSAQVPVSGAPIPVVGAENFYGDLLQQIGGDRVSVTSLLSDPNADPHAYESNAKDAQAIADAKLVVQNGAGYDTFVDHLAAASPNPQRKIIDASALTGHATGDNPHLWYDPAIMPKVAQAVADALSRIDRTDAAYFQARLETFLASLQPLDQLIAQIKSDDAGLPVAITEPVFGYMAQALGLKVATPAAFAKAVEDGNDPPAAAEAQAEDLLSKRQVRVLIYNQQTVTPITTKIQQLAKQAGVPVVGVSETEPQAETYQQWLTNELRRLQAALATGAGH